MWQTPPKKVQQIANAAGLQKHKPFWNTAYKGIDDWQLALRQEETKKKRLDAAQSYGRELPLMVSPFRKDRTMGILSEMDMMNRDVEDDAF